MTNPEIFDITGKLIKQMGKAGLLVSQAKDVKQGVFEMLKPLLCDYASQAAEKKSDAAEAMEFSKLLATDDEFAKGWLIQQLAKSVQSENGNTQAAKELRDLLRIGSTESELVIERANYYPLCAKCGADID